MIRRVLGAAGSIAGPLGVGGAATAYNWYLGPWPATAPYPAEAAIPAANCVAAYQPHWGAGTIYARTDAASYANSKTNLNDPATHLLADGVGGVAAWAAITGWTWASVNHTALVTDIVPLAAYSALVEVANITNATPYLFGSFGGGNSRFLVHASSAVANVRYYYGSGFWDRAPAAATGNFGLVGSDKQGYRNGSADGAAGATIWTDPGPVMWVGGANGVSFIPITGSESSFAVYSVALTANQVANIAWAMGKISGRVP